MSKSNKRGRDQELAAQSKHTGTDRAWRSSKHLFPAHVRNQMEALLDGTNGAGLSHAELKSLVTAQLFNLLSGSGDDELGDRSNHILSAMRLLHRILTESGDSGSVDTIEVVVPAGLTTIAGASLEPDEGDDI